MKTFIGFKEALDLTLSSVPLGGVESLPLSHLSGRVLSEEDMVSRVDCPFLSTSLKDGYAVLSSDLIETSQRKTKRLRVTGHLTAGGPSKGRIKSGGAIRVMTGAPIPDGATAVLSEEFCRLREDEIECFNRADPGQNILKAGTDVRRGEIVAVKGERLSPALIGLLASAGLEKAKVYKIPRVAVIATGDELVAPGGPLSEGKLYASNMVEICAWLSQMAIPHETELVRDREKEIGSAIMKHLSRADAFVTSGGAWGSERDLIMRVLEDLKWQGIYHRVRMGPGKAAGFGLLRKKPFFCLPGGPPSSEMAFLQLALPGLMAMEGYPHPIFPLITARLGETVRGDREWTQFIHARLIKGRDHLKVRPSLKESRLKSMARKEALIIIPEGREELPKGEEIDIQLLIPYGSPPAMSQPTDRLDK